MCLNYAILSNHNISPDVTETTYARPLTNLHIIANNNIIPHDDILAELDILANNHTCSHSPFTHVQIYLLLLI
jgi:hypothetical protein